LIFRGKSTRQIKKNAAAHAHIGTISVFTTDTKTIFSNARPLSSYTYLCGTSDIQWLVQAITTQVPSRVLQHPYLSASLLLLTVYSKCPQRVNQFLSEENFFRTLTKKITGDNDTRIREVHRKLRSHSMKILMLRFAVAFDHNATYVSACFNPQKSKMKIYFLKVLQRILLPICDTHQISKCCIEYSRKAHINS